VTEVELEDPAAQQLVQISAYTLDARLEDAAGALMGKTDVTVVSTQPCMAIVNGVSALMLPGVNYTVTTDDSGGLHIVIPTQNISAPTLTFMLSGQTLQSVPLNSKILQSLSQKTAADYSSAEDASGNSLFPNAAAAALQQTVSQLCQFAIDPPQNAPADAETDAARPALGGRLSFEPGGRATFAAIEGRSRSDAEAPSELGDAGDWISDRWDDVKDLVSSNTGKIKDISWTPATDGLEITINLTIDGVTQSYEYLLQAADPNLTNSVLDLATALMLQAGATVEQVTEWLSLLFDWNRISLTRQAIEYTFETCFSLLEQSAQGIQTQFDAQVTSGVFNTEGKDLQTAVASIKNMTLQAVAGFAATDVQLPRVQADLFVNQLKIFAPQASAVDTTQGFNTALQNLLQSVQAIAGNVSGNSAVQAQEAAPPVAADQVLQLTVDELFVVLQAVVNSLISLVQQAVDGLLALGSDGFTALYDLLANTTLEIPWVSDLYQAKFGEPMTVLGAVTAAIAIPATAAFTAVAGRPPFASSSDVTDFENGFTPGNLLGIWGLAQSGWQQQVSANSLARLEDAANLLALGGFATRVYVDQFLDAMAAGQLTMSNPASFALSTADIASSMALFASSACALTADMVSDPTSAPNAILAAALAVDGAHWAIGTLFTCAPGIANTLRLEGDAGICLDMALSSAATALATLADGLDYGITFDATEPPIALGGDVLSAFAAIGHIGLISGVVTSSDGASVPPALLLDLISDDYGLLMTAQGMQPSHVTPAASVAALLGLPSAAPDTLGV
jgi:hypothetical protein